MTKDDQMRQLHSLLFAATYVREIIDDPKTTSAQDLNALARIHIGITDYMRRLEGEVVE
jgi:hypothetical protein